MRLQNRLLSAGRRHRAVSAWRESGGFVIFPFPFSERPHGILEGAVRAQKLAGTHFQIGTQRLSANWDQRRLLQDRRTIGRMNRPPYPSWLEWPPWASWGFNQGLPDTHECTFQQCGWIYFTDAQTHWPKKISRELKINIKKPFLSFLPAAAWTRPDLTLKSRC